MIETSFYPPHVKPVRPGVYRTQYSLRHYGTEHRGYSFWNGKEWSTQRATVEGAFTTRHRRGWRQDKQWCGLARAPE